MKFILTSIFILLMFSCGKSVISVVQAHENTEPSDCKNTVVLKPLAGSYYMYCPRGTVVTASRSNVSGRFSYTYVLCAKVELSCEPTDDIHIDPIDPVSCGFVGCEDQRFDETN